MASVNRSNAERLSKEPTVGVGVLTVENEMSAEDHGYILSDLLQARLSVVPCSSRTERRFGLRAGAAPSTRLIAEELSRRGTEVRSGLWGNAE